MHDDPRIRETESERAALQEDAARIVSSASAQGRTLTDEEDAHVLALMARVRALEEEIHRLTRHHPEPRGGERE